MSQTSKRKRIIICLKEGSKECPCELAEVCGKLGGDADIDFSQVKTKRA